MNREHLTKYVVRPTLLFFEPSIPFSEAAVELVVNTAYAESNGEYLKQHGDGPAIGLFQMEPATEDDIWQNYLRYRDVLSGKVNYTLNGFPTVAQLAGNLHYATAMCRIHYRRAPEKLPEVGDLKGQAAYWKKYYNTELGKGTVEHFIKVNNV